MGERLDSVILRGFSKRFCDSLTCCQHVTAQKAAGLFCSKGTVLAPRPHRDTKVLLCRAAPSCSACPAARVIPPQTASASPLPELHEPGPLLSPLSSLRSAAQVCRAFLPVVCHTVRPRCASFHPVRRYAVICQGQHAAFGKGRSF